MRHLILRIVFCIAVTTAFAFLTPGNAFADTGTWDQPTGNWIWQDAGNWAGATPGDVMPPGVGDTAHVAGSNRWELIAIDMDGSSYDFERIQGNYNGFTVILYDSNFLTPNANPLGSSTDFALGSYGSLVEAANASPMLTVNDLMYSKGHRPTFYMPLTVNDELWPSEDGTTNFYGDVTVDRMTEARNSGWKTRVNFKSDLTAGSVFSPHRGDAAHQILTVDGLATIGTFIGEGATANFNDLRITNELRQANESTVNIAGRFSGTGTYIRDANVSGETRTPSLNLLGSGTLAPGDSVGVLGSTALSVNMAGGSTYEWEIADPLSTPGVGWDLSLADTFNIDGPLNFQIVPLGLTENIAAGDEFAVLGANGFDLTDINLSTDVAFSILGDPTGWDITGANLSVIQGYGDLDGITGNEDALVLSGIIARFGAAAVPEPMSLAIWALLGVGLFVIGRRRRS